MERTCGLENSPGVGMTDNNRLVDRGKGLSAESVSGKLRQPFLGGMLYVFYNVYMKRATFRGGGVGPPCC